MNKMKKNSLVEGALIATIGIVIVKVIGFRYVLPFNAIIGEQGGALYENLEETLNKLK